MIIYENLTFILWFVLVQPLASCQPYFKRTTTSEATPSQRLQ